MDDRRREMNGIKLRKMVQHDSQIHTMSSWNPQKAEREKNSYKSVKARAWFKRPVYHTTVSKVV